MLILKQRRDHWPRLPSFPKHWTSPLRIEQNCPFGTAKIPAHTVPSLSSSNASTFCLGISTYSFSLPSFQLASPPRVPIHKVPSRPASRLRMFGARQVLSAGRSPFHKSNAIKTDQTKFGGKPKIAVGSLGDCANTTPQEAIPSRPCLV